MIESFYIIHHKIFQGNQSELMDLLQRQRVDLMNKLYLYIFFGGWACGGAAFRSPRYEHY